MKVKTSVTLSQDLLDEVDQRVSQGGRSSFVEAALRDRLRELRRRERDERDIQIYKRLADDPQREKALEEMLAVQEDMWSEENSTESRSPLVTPEATGSSS